MRRRRSSLLSLTLFSLALVSVAALPLTAQNAGPDSAPPATTLHVNSRTVVVDVVVTDSSDHAVTGLPREGFQVLEDGKPQTISYFEEHSAAAPTGGQGVAAAPLPPDTFSNVPAAPLTDSVNLLLMDALNTPMADQMYVHRQMVKYLAAIPPGTRLGIFTLSDRLRIIQGFTTDTAVLRAAIARSATNPAQSGLLPTAEEAALDKQGAAQIASMGPQGAASQAAASAALADFASHKDEFAVDERISNTLDAFQQIARYLAGVPGRKNLMWLSASFPLCIFSDKSCPYQEKVQETVDLLAKAQVSIYPIASGGLAPDLTYDASAPPDHSLDANLSKGTPAAKQATNLQTTNLAAGSVERATSQNTMDELARDTGGKAVYNANDLSAALQRDIANGARYYTIAYTPTNRSEGGRRRTIAVQFAPGKYYLAYRRGYYEDTAKALLAAETAPTSDPLHPLMDRGMPDFTEIRYRMRIVPVAPQPAADAARAGDNAALPGPVTRYRTTFMLGTDGIALDPVADGNHHGSIEVALVVYSHDGKPLNWVVRTLNLTLTPQQFEAVQQSGIPFRLEIDAPRGDVYLRSGIYDPSTRKAGTLEVPLTAVTPQQGS